MHMRRNRRPTITSIRDHHHRVIDANLRMQEFAGGVGEATQFYRAKDIDQKFDSYTILLAAGHRPHDQKRFCARCDRIGQRGIRRLM